VEPDEKWSEREYGHEDRSSVDEPEKYFVDTRKSDRVLDVSLHGGPIEPGRIVTLTLAVLLARSKSRGHWQQPFSFDPSAGPLSFHVEAAGFQIITPFQDSVDVPPDQDSKTYAAVLEVLDGTERWITVIMLQRGRQIADITIDDFSPLQPVEHSTQVPIRPVRSVDLTLLVRRGDRHIEAESPSSALSMYGYDLGQLKELAEAPLAMLGKQLRGLYDKSETPESVEKKLKLLGAELAKCLPEDLRRVLCNNSLRVILLRHDVDFDFPLEICYIEDDEKSFFVGDRIAVCRWYWGTKCPPDSTSKVVGKIAVLMGATSASAAQKDIIADVLGMAPVEIRTNNEVVEKVFTQSTFDVLHFIGHCSRNEDGMGCLELSDKSSIPLMQIGQLKEESVFSRSRPLVVLNGCATGKPYITLTGKDSFAHRFVQSQAIAFVGTLWPVDETTANRFSSLFYRSIKAGISMSEAMLSARRILAGIEDDPDADVLTPAQQLASRIAARSYCLFAHPDLRVLT
jgi:hypothetical protein